MKNKIYLQKKKGFLFFITGFSGSGKSSIAKRIKKDIRNNYGPTILLHGDEIRSLFNLKGYSSADRKKIAMQYSKLCKKITDNGINVILATVSLYSIVRKWNKANIVNYIEIYIKSDLSKIIKQKKKFFYRKKTKNVVGLTIKPELPKKPHIILKNDFKKSITILSNSLIKKIQKNYEKNDKI
ncbi:adenylyl-sulfate kinase [Pelagibacteraceae bacterium]|nr:adenylyl-sulfate kinase [Pelagibacteraceae bacterium]